MDFAGPLFVRDGTSKGYILLITCTTTIALLLELVPSVITEDLLMVFRRHVARRRTPSTISPKVLGVLLKFRTYKIALVANTKKKKRSCKPGFAQRIRALFVSFGILRNKMEVSFKINCEICVWIQFNMASHVDLLSFLQQYTTIFKTPEIPGKRQLKFSWRYFMSTTLSLKRN